MQEFTVQLFDDGSAQISGTGANLELRFGYSKNAHVYSVKFIRSEEWEDLYIRVHFHPEADIYDVEPVLAQNNIVNIPATVTSMPGEGKLTIEGTDGHKTITSADIPYRVSENSGIDSDTDPEPGESSFQQFVDAVKKDAESATQAAKDAGDILKETKEAGASALTDIETAKDNAISEIEKIESEVKGEIQEDVESAKSSAEAAAKSAGEAKTAADSAKKSLSDLETAKESALSEISKEKDTSVSAVGSAKEAALNEISATSDSAVKSVKTAETNAINAVKTEGSTQKTAINNASSAALTSIETAKTNAAKAVEDKASEESLAIDEKASQVIGSVQNAGDAELLAIGQATNSSIEQITQNAGQHLTQIDSAADEAVTDITEAKEDSLSELEAVNAHPPIQNSETGKWQVWNAESQSYVDTEYDWEGGYYSPSVDSEGNLTWESSKEGMNDIPSSNIRGPQGLGVPTSTANDYGKAPTVNVAGTGYELTGPYAPLSAAIIETAKGNPAVCEDSVEWGLQGMRVYGKSSQVTTTGAQLFDFRNTTRVHKPSNISINKINIVEGGLYVGITMNGYWYEKNVFYSFDENSDTFFVQSASSGYGIGFLSLCEPMTQYIFSLSNLDNKEIAVSYYDESGTIISWDSNVSDRLGFTTPENAHYVMLVLRPYEEGHYKNLMLNAGSTPLPFEPYTGGKPSPSPDYPQEIHSAGDEGEINIGVTGANVLNPNDIETENDIVLFTVVGMQPGQYTLSFVSTADWWSGNENGRYLFIHYYKELDVKIGQDDLAFNNAAINVRSYASFTVPEGTVKSVLYTYSATTKARLTDLMINAGSAALPFEPYKTPQSLSFDTPDGLPGIPVNSGGNFVDETGQEWICNYRDWARGVDVQNFGECVVDGSTVKFKDNNNPENPIWNLPNNTAPNTDQTKNKCYWSSYFPYSVFGANTDFHFLWTQPANMEPYGFTTVEELNAFCVEKNSEGKPLTIMYGLTAPIETLIPADELAAYRALHAYDGTTVITPDDALAEVEVDYIVKQKAYIEKKLTAIESRLNALEISEALEGE